MRQLFFYLFLLGVAFAGQAQLKLPRLFGDHMVLQRDTPVRFWGWATPNETIQLTIDGFTVATKANQNGEWETLYPSHLAGGPFEVVVKGSTELKFKDVYFGDVWVAGGQSNMEWKLSWKVNNWEQEVKNSTFPQIRFFEVADQMSLTPKQDIESGDWKVAGPETSPQFSAVAWHFAKANHLEKGVPVGIVDSNWGGTPAEAWTSTHRTLGIPGYEKLSAEMLDPSIDWEARRKENDDRNELKWKLIDDQESFMKIGAHLPDYDDSAWGTVSLPNSNELNDFVWVRKTIELTKSKNVRFYMGEITQICHIFFNGTLVSKETWQDTTAILNIPAALVKDEKNVIAIRVVNSWDNRAWIGRRGQMWIESRGKKTPLEGEWKYSTTIEPALPKVEFFHWRPGMLFNGMIAPIAGYSIKGVIWYQGENNAGTAELYEALFEGMIEDWRMHWQQGRFPFLYVQLANFMERKSEPSESDWAELREAQTRTLDLPNTGMATIIDIGDAQDIHPRNKHDVGKRLWLAARKVAYWEEVVHSGPMYKSHKSEGSTVTVEFDFANNGLKAGTEVIGFELAGADGKFHWAKGRIDGSRVILTSDKVAEPLHVRYAWADNPACNLYNTEGLPAVPFRSSK